MIHWLKTSLLLALNLRYDPGTEGKSLLSIANICLPSDCSISTLLLLLIANVTNFPTVHWKFGTNMSQEAQALFISWILCLAAFSCNVWKLSDVQQASGGGGPATTKCWWAHLTEVIMKRVKTILLAGSDESTTIQQLWTSTKCNKNALTSQQSEHFLAIMQYA